MVVPADDHRQDVAAYPVNLPRIQPRLFLHVRAALMNVDYPERLEMRNPIFD